MDNDFLFNNNDFVKFNKQQKTHRKSSCYITISRYKTFMFTVGFMKQYKEQINDLSYIEFYYSASKNTILIKFKNRTDSKDDNTFKINNGTVSATSFFTSNNIELPKYSGRYVPKYENIPEIGNVFVIDLKAKENKL
jgi:hypothetical protein